MTIRPEIILSALNKFCSVSKIVCESWVDGNVAVMYVPDHHKKYFNDIVNYSNGISKNNSVTCRYSKNGGLIAVGQQLSEDRFNRILDATHTKFNKLYNKLDEALNAPIVPSRPVVNEETKHVPEKQIDRIKSFDEQLNEALNGIATPDGSQPSDGLSALFKSLKDSGLYQQLKDSGVTWHIANPGKFKITFKLNNIPILQYASLDLVDPKKLGGALSSLHSIASGKAPQAGQIELEMAKKVAADARDREKRLTDLAAQYTEKYSQNKQLEQQRIAGVR